MSSSAPTTIVAPDERNARGIPRAPFISDVEKYLGGPEGEVEIPLRNFQEAIAKYRYMENNLAQRRRGLEEKIPDIRKTLSMVEYLQGRREGKSKASDEDDLDDDLDEGDSKKPMRTTFELNDTLYAEAELEDTDTVFLWLGANVMLSYKLPEAVTLLKSKLEAASTSLQNAIEDMEFIREQLTVMEVNTARVYNWDVKRRREKRTKEEAQEKLLAEKTSDMLTLKRKALRNLYEGDDDAIDPVYQAKANVLNEAIQEIGMGKYQWSLFLVAGFGWFARSDSVWPLLSGLILAPVLAEFNFKGPFLSLAANIGLLVGAVVWGVGCDIWGRRWSFNLTLLITGIFGLSAGSSPSFVALASLIAVVGVGVGGNMPVDSAVFLDFVPGTHQYLLTIMSIFWAFGQLIVSLIAWPFIANYSCDPAAQTCERKDNMGWRYLLFTLGAITLFMWGLRFFVFTLLESPRYLVGLGKDQEAVDVILHLAKFNGTTSDLTIDRLKMAEKSALGVAYESDGDHAPGGGKRKKLLSQSSAYGLSHIKALFRTRKLGTSTSLLIAIWGIIGLASTLYNNFLPFILNSRGTAFGDGSLYITYRNIMYGVLYAISPEVFPAKHRGTGNGLTATATRVFGVIAPIIALYANLQTAAPVYIAGGLIMAAGVVTIFLPYEPRGKASL
ncbi:hypothetical protein ONZ45_g18242 [Pleurotus djamor]|nr:hypothetical protein ONZ45_g18242 [Pleurotus djamor]